MKIIEVDGLTISFPVLQGILRRKQGSIIAVENVSFSIQKGQTLGLVGESGCGKTTIGKSILNIYRPDSGSINYNFEDKSITVNRNNYQRRNFSIIKNVQMILQDPFTALNPRMNIYDILAEPLKSKTQSYSSAQIDESIRKIIDLCKISKNVLHRYPHEFSGGQRQRISIARALILRPKLVVCDESVSALDVSIQSEILNLLNELKRELLISYLFISHDLNVVAYMSDMIAVMYLGSIVECGPKEQILKKPYHPYTQALLHTIPQISEEKIVIANYLKGEIPDLRYKFYGCNFYSRCKNSQNYCNSFIPNSQSLSQNHTVKCHFPNSF